MTRRAAWWAWLLVAANLVLQGWVLFGRGPSQAAAREPGRAVRFMTLNVQFFLSSEPGFTSNLDAIGEVLAAERPDIVALQETETGSLLGGNQNGVLWLGVGKGFYYHYGLPGSAYTPGVGLLSRWPIRAAEYRRLPATGSIPRGAIRALIDAPGGELTVIVAHLQWAEPYLPGEPTAVYLSDQTAQARELIRLAGGGRRVAVLGDFNAGPGYPGPAYDLFRTRFVDAWVAAGNPPDTPAGFTWPVAEPTMRIDFVWFSPGDWDVGWGTARVLGDRTLSDHRAVIVDATPRASPAAP